MATGASSPQPLSTLFREIGAEVDAGAQELVDLCSALVAEPSHNPPGNTRGVARVMTSWLQKRGLEARHIAMLDEAPNIVSTVDGAGRGRHIVLNAHMDTISPGDEAEWTVPIHNVTRRDDKLWGLGIGNMKGGLAAMCFALDLLKKHCDGWHGRVTLSAVSDEVVLGDRGSAFLLERDPMMLGDALLSGEGPGGMGLAVAEKGVAWLELVARCPSGQAMLVEEGDSAVARLARVITRIDELNRREVEPVNALADVQRTPHAFRVSANVGVVRAGTVPNQVASRAMAQVDLRLPPGLGLEGIESEIDDIVSDVEGVSWRRLRGWDPSWTSTEHPLARAVIEAARYVRSETPAQVVRLPASDASRWRRSGVPAVCYGPQPTSAVGVDDYVYERDLIDCAKVYAIAALQFLSEEASS